MGKCKIDIACIQETHDKVDTLEEYGNCELFSAQEEVGRKEERKRTDSWEMEKVAKIRNIMAQG